MTPYYEADGITLYHGNCLEVTFPTDATTLVTDPPYPNNAGWFLDGIDAARQVIANSRWREALIFWTELERPPSPLSPVAVHVWHRTNVNGRPYEPIFHFAQDDKKRRSDVFTHAAIFDGVGPGCREYLGHPTQKPEALMRRLVSKTSGILVDPFAGVGATLVAARSLQREAIGVEIEERYCEVIASRLAQGELFGGAA